MAHSPRTPHDALFRAIFDDPEAVRGELLAVLPSPLREMVGLATITRVPGRFADESFRGLETDALFRVELEGQPPLLVYVLFEHQSRVDPLMPWRLLQYMVAVWTKAMNEAPTRMRLPPLLPIVLSNAPGGWRTPRRLVDLLDAPRWLRAAMAANTPAFEFVLDDLVDVSVTDLSQRPLSPFAKLGLWLMRTARDRPRLEREFPTWDALLEGLKGRPRELFRLLVYLRAVANMSIDEVLALTRVRLGEPEDAEMITARDIWLSSFTPEWREEVEALARERGFEAGREEGKARGVELGLEQGLQEGRQAGLQEGRQEGRQEGHRQGLEEGLLAGQRLALLALLASKFGEVSHAHRARIDAASGELLARWLPRVLSGHGIDDVLAD